MEASVIPISASHVEAISRLSLAAHKNPMALNEALDWNIGVDKSLPPKPYDQCWIYTTEYLHTLTTIQQLETLWLENARDISMFIWLEQTIPPLYMGYINQYYDCLSEPLREFLMIFSKEEIVHTLVFKRYMALADLPMFAPPEGLHDLLSKILPTMAPPIGILCTLIIEWMAEESAQYAIKNNDQAHSSPLDELTCQLYQKHHIDEARHIAFGRWVAQDYLHSLNEEQFAHIKSLVTDVVNRMLDQFTYNPTISDHTSFTFPIDKTDEKTIESIRRTDHNLLLNQQRFSAIFSWLNQVGLY